MKKLILLFSLFVSFRCFSQQTTVTWSKGYCLYNTIKLNKIIDSVGDDGLIYISNGKSVPAQGLIIDTAIYNTPSLNFQNVIFRVIKDRHIVACVSFTRPYSSRTWHWSNEVDSTYLNNLYHLDVMKDNRTLFLKY